MTERTYEINNDYILDVLEREEDRLTEQILLNDNISKSIKFDFRKLLAVRNEIERINIQKLLNKDTIAI